MAIARHFVIRLMNARWIWLYFSRCAGRRRTVVFLCLPFGGYRCTNAEFDFSVKRVHPIRRYRSDIVRAHVPAI